MWNKVSLTLKITGPLILMEILGLVFGGLTLIAKIEKARLKEMDALLIGQADLVEESFRFNKGPPIFAGKHDLFGDLERDPKIYFQVIDASGKVLHASKGPRPERRQQLSEALLARSKVRWVKGELFDLNIGNDKWRATREELSNHEISGLTTTWQVYTAIDETASVGELNTIRNLIIIGAIGLAIMSSLATAAIVLLTTSNLRLFAQSLSHINRDNPVWTFPVLAQSAEETLLFASFGKMMGDMETSRQNQKIFIANASHELKTPVAGIMAALEVLLARERSPAEYQAVCRDLLKTVKDMRRLTGALLDTSLIEGGKLQPFESLSLNDCVENVLDRWQAALHAKGLQLQWQASVADLKIMGNRDLIDVAISNLIDNAIKYSFDKGRVEIGLKRVPDDLIRLTIKDHGIGMDEAEREKLGTIFFRADPSRSTKDSFGLGYANARKILLSHGARLTVVSAPRVGTEISILFPKA